MINDIDDYRVSYNLFLAESEMHSKIAEYTNQIVFNESVDIDIIEEGVKESVIGYINKVVAQVKSAWSKYKAKFTESLSSLVNKAGKKVVSDKNINFTIDNYKDYDLSKLKNYQIKPFNYEDMKDSLKSENDYVKKYYPDLNLDIHKNITDAMRANVMKNIEKQPCNQEFLSGLITDCKESFKDVFADIENNIKSLDDSNTTISNLVNNLTPSNESTIIWESMVLDIIREATNDDKDKKTTFTDSSGDTTDADNSSENKNKNITKEVAVYMRVSTKILSAKFKISFEAYMNSGIDIIKHYMDNIDKNPTAVKDSGSENTQTVNKIIEK